MRFAAVTLAALVAVDPWGWDRFGPLRWALISTLAFAAIASALGEASFRERPLPRWVILGWTLLLGGLSLSAALSSDRLYALTGTPDRHLGLLSWFMFLGLFATASLRAGSATRPVLRALTVGAVVAGSYSILELAQVDWFDQGFSDGRVGATFGQPAILGAAMVLAIPAAASSVVDYAEPRLWRIAGLAGTGLGATALLASQSRAAWVGFGVAALVVAAAQQKRLRTRFGNFRIAGLAIGLMAIVATIAATTSVGDRAQTLADPDSAVFSGRLDEWQIGGRALIGSKLGGVVGYGPETYRTVFGEYVDEQYVIDYGRDSFTDRAHNGPLDTALAGGLLAGLGLLLLHVGLTVECLRAIRRSPTDVALAAATLAYMVQQLFLFPLSELDPVLYILAGLLIGRSSSARPVRKRPVLFGVPRSRQLAMLAAGLLAAVSTIAGLTNVVGDHRISAATSETDRVTALAHADAARDLRPDSIRYDLLASQIAREPATVDALRAALERLDEGLDSAPNDPALLIERAGVLLDIARSTESADDLLQALRALEDRDRTDPNNPLTQQWYGIALAIADKTEEAILVLNHAVLLAPDSIEPLINLAVVQLEDGDLVAGSGTLDRAQRLTPGNATISALRRQFLSG